jgi:hypothetical protein
MMKFRISKSKNIGKVVYLVEGARKEINLIKHLYLNIFDYQVVAWRRGQENAEVFQSSTNVHSQVFVINTENSNISSIQTGQEYLDTILQYLFDTFQLEIDNAAVYYLFDRDRGSNNAEITKGLIRTLGNARDNGECSNGLLLLSYPSIESFVISCFESETYNKQVLNLKAYLGEQHLQQHQINDTHLPHSLEELQKTVQVLIHQDLSIDMLDRFSSVHEKIFDREECHYVTHNYYRLLSLLILSFWDLGLLYQDNE